MDRRCRGCSRQFFGEHSFCSACRAASGLDSPERTVYVGESGYGIEVDEYPPEPAYGSHSRYGGQESQDFYSPGHNAASGHARRDRGQYASRHEEDISRGYRHVSATGETRDLHRYEEDLIDAFRYISVTKSTYQAEHHDDRCHAEDRDGQGHDRHRRGGRGRPREDDREWQRRDQTNRPSSRGRHRQGERSHNDARETSKSDSSGQPANGEVTYAYAGTWGPDGELLDEP